jgi:hypothetical protein
MSSSSEVHDFFIHARMMILFKRSYRHPYLKHDDTHLCITFPSILLRAARRGALAKSITGYHENMVRKQYPVLELANQMPVRNMDLARAPRRTARKKGSGYENGFQATVSPSRRQ